MPFASLTRHGSLKGLMLMGLLLWHARVGLPAPPTPLAGHLRSGDDLRDRRDIQTEWEDGVLTLSSTAATLFARATIPPPPGGWDLASRATIDAELMNTGKHPVGVMVWVVGDHGWEAVLDSAVLEPRETRRFSCDLRAAFPDGTPRLNPGDVSGVQIMLGQPVTGGRSRDGNSKAAAQFAGGIIRPVSVMLRSLAARGEQPPWRRPPGRIDVPTVEEGGPEPGRRVRYRLAGDEQTGIASILNLPEDWQAGRKYPVIVEYPGNIFLGPACYSTGLPDQCLIGYGMTRGRGAICLGLPFLDRASGRIVENGWGNADETADYAVRMVAEVCEKFGGDPDRVVLTGFSRGAIACGYIGLRNERIAALWKGFHACQHYDGGGWNGADMPGALGRATRFKGVAVFQTDNPREKYQAVMDAMKTEVTWADSGLHWHSTAMFLDDRPSTKQLRDWFWRLVGEHVTESQPQAPQGTP
jgi:hypothetical protein